MNDWPESENDILRNRVKELTDALETIYEEIKTVNDSNFYDAKISTVINNTIEILEEHGAGRDEKH